MARPPKEGVDYFPLDCVLDGKFELIEAEFGLDGFGVVVKLLQKIYGQRGYYIEWTNEVALLFAKNIGLGGSVVSEILSAAVKRGIFNSTVFEKYAILTSPGIQERYLDAVKRRKSVELITQYLLVDVASIYDDVNINVVYVDINPQNVSNNPQSKGKKSKENNSSSNPRAQELAMLMQYCQENAFGAAIRAGFDQLQGWLDDGYPGELLRFAIQQAALNGKPNWAYVGGMLAKWKDKNIWTLEAAESEKLQWEHEKAARGAAKNVPPSKAPTGSTAPRRKTNDELAAELFGIEATKR